MKLDGKAMQQTVITLPPKMLKLFQESYLYESGDELAPFFSERFLYPLLGKDEARRVLREVGYYDSEARRKNW